MDKRTTTTTSMVLLRRAMRALSLAAAACIAPLAAGCAAPTAREVLMNHYTAAYVYHHPTAQVKAHVRRLLEKRGFQVMPIAQGEAVRTEWKLLIGTEEIATVKERYYVVVHRLTQEHSRVMAARLEYSTLSMESYHPTVPLRRDQDGSKLNTRSDAKSGKALQFAKPRVIRDFHLEWDLIRRVDPERARQIEATVDQALAERGAREVSATAPPTR